MTAVEIEEAISQLAEAPFDPLDFPYAFLEAFGNKVTTAPPPTRDDARCPDVGVEKAIS